MPKIINLRLSKCTLQFNKQLVLLQHLEHLSKMQYMIIQCIVVNNDIIHEYLKDRRRRPEGYE
jgi:hypothetical protein